MNTHASSLWNFCRLSFLASFKNVWIEISSNEIFSISSYTKNCSKKFTDHLNAIDTGYKLQKRQTGSLSNDQSYEWNLDLVWLQFLLQKPENHSERSSLSQQVSVREICASAYFFFTAFGTERSQRAFTSNSSSKQYFITHTKNTFKNCLRERHLNVLKIFFSLKWISKEIFPPKFDSRLVNADWLITWQVKQTLDYAN